MQKHVPGSPYASKESSPETRAVGQLSAIAGQRSYCLLLPVGGGEIYAEDAPVGNKVGCYPIMLPKIVG